MSKAGTRASWVSAVLDAASSAGIELPAPTRHTAGDLIFEGPAGTRFATIKRRFVSIDEAASRGVELTLWRREHGSSAPVVAIHEALSPSPKRATFVASILEGWLIRRWSKQKAVANCVSPTTSGFELEPIAAEQGDFWLSDDQAFGIVVKQDYWSVRAKRATLSSWRSKDGDRGGAKLPLEWLDALCKWLAENWGAIAYGTDLRPEPLRSRSVAASRAFENATLAIGDNPGDQDQLKLWWSRHAIRAANEELPNLFLERQGDDIVVSWDPQPTGTRFYQISAGDEVLPAEFAVPKLRELVASRVERLGLHQPTRRFFDTTPPQDAAYEILSAYHPGVTKAWLAHHRLDADGLKTFGMAGVSRNPVVGLLRSSQGSSMSLEDIDQVVLRLSPSDLTSYRQILQLVRGMDSRIDTREPWESGYRLADLVRERLGKRPEDFLDVDREALHLGIQLYDLSMSDNSIKAVCVGAPAYRPIVVINQACDDATGESGRRITLAHELCHLLFDRGRMKGLARVEGDKTEGDRLIEMRANAFAVQLLVPMSTLTHDDGTMLTDDELADVSVDKRVSLAALSWHARNLRNRLEK